MSIGTIKRRISELPSSPGVYIMRGKEGEVLYVGKARDLKKRVSSYIGGKDKRYQVRALLSHTTEIEHIVTHSEKEAVLLEYNLIQKHRPRYNISYRDDKSYTKIRLTMQHPFPAIYITRKTPPDGSLYFGPYVSAEGARKTVEMIRRLFGIRNCSDRTFSHRTRPCIQYEIKRCHAPCTGLIGREEYKRYVDDAILFLNGNANGLLKNLEEEMGRLSKEMRYEEAARRRDTIRWIKETLSPQAVSHTKRDNRDYIGVWEHEAGISVAILESRGGLLIGCKRFDVRPGASPAESLLEEFLISYYLKTSGPMPDTIVLSKKTPFLTGLSEALREGNRSIKFLTSPRGIDRVRLEMAAENAREGARRALNIREAPAELAKVLGLKTRPRLIAASDISNIGGEHAVGAVVVFASGEPKKELYRRFLIKGVFQPDDYKMMEEVLERYLTSNGLPDLLIIDGGKGHLAVARRIVEKLGLDLGLAAIAKDGEGDKVYIPNRKDPVVFKRGSPAYLLLQRIRNEAHRFAISYYRKRHIKAEMVSRP